jgi:hypothetical protein
MMKVKLPLVSSSTDLDTALQKLKREKRAALITVAEGQYSLITAANIAVGRHEGKTALSDLTADQILAVAEAEKEQEALMVGVEVSVPSGGGRGEPSFGFGDFILESAKASSAFVRIKDRDIAARYVASPNGYCCVGPRRHDDFPPPPVSVGCLCPRGDGYTVIAI